MNTGNRPGTDSDPVIDLEVLESLRSLDEGGSLVLDVVTTFLDFVPDQVGKFEQAMSTGDVETMGRVVHTLKSSSGNVGATRLSRIFSGVEAELRAGKHLSEADVAGMRSELGLVDRELRKYLGSTGSA